MLEVSNRKLHDITKQDSYVCLSNAAVHRKLQAEPAEHANIVAMLFLMVLGCWLFLQTCGHEGVGCHMKLGTTWFQLVSVVIGLF